MKVTIKQESLETVIKWLDTLTAPHNQVVEAQNLLRGYEEVKKDVTKDKK